MKKLINETEFKRILMMHHDAKRKEYGLLREEDEQQKLKDQLQEFLDNRCITNPDAIVIGWGTEGKTPANRRACIKKPSTKNPPFVCLFIDRSVLTFDPQKKKKTALVPGKWKCEASYLEGVKKEDLAKLQDYKNKEGWVEYKDLESKGMSKVGADKGYYDETTYQIGTKTIKLYREKGKAGILAGYTNEEKTIIKRYQKAGYKLQDDLTVDEKNVWKPVTVELAGGRKITMYRNPEGVASIAERGDGDFERLSDNQSIDAKTCKAKLESYYKAYKKKDEFPESIFTNMKNQVTKCVNQHHPNWGGLRPGYFRDMVNTLRGGKGGPSDYGDDVKWKID